MILNRLGSFIYNKFPPILSSKNQSLQTTSFDRHTKKMKLAIVSAVNLVLVAAHGGSHVDCGYQGITKEACEVTGQCAHNSGLKDEPTCYYKFAVRGASCQISCERLGGVWDPKGAMDNHKDWQIHYACYYPNTARLPAVGGRQSGKHPGTSSYE